MVVLEPPGRLSPRSPRAGRLRRRGAPDTATHDAVTLHSTALACRGEVCPTGPGFIEVVLDHLPDSELKARARAALTLGAEVPIARVVATLGNGSNISAQDTPALVLWCASQHPEDFERALWLAVSALGDRDTTCAMVGGIVACARP